jgi:hypothetical protein
VEIRKDKINLESYCFAVAAITAAMHPSTSLGFLAII